MAPLPGESSEEVYSLRYDLQASQIRTPITSRLKNQRVHLRQRA